MMVAVTPTKSIPMMIAGIPTVHRGPHWSPIHPSTGETNGVPPSRRVDHRLMTRPRICGDTEVCTIELATMSVETAPQPTGTLSSAKRK